MMIKNINVKMRNVWVYIYIDRFFIMFCFCFMDNISMFRIKNVDK